MSLSVYFILLLEKRMFVYVFACCISVLWVCMCVVLRDNSRLTVLILSAVLYLVTVHK